MSTPFTIHPKELADLLANAVDIGKDKPAVSINELVMLSCSGAYLSAYGRGRYTAGRDWREVGTDVPLSGQLCLTEAECEELATVLRGTEGSGRKGTTVTVTLRHREAFSVTAGTDILCQLPDADPTSATFGEPDEVSDWEEIDNLITSIEEHAGLTSPWACSTEILTRLNKIRSPTHVADFAIHQSGRIAGVAFGPSFRAVVAGVVREGYAQGGPWGNGPGEPEHLWGHLAALDAE